MARQNRLMSIPDDWTEEDGYQVVLFCIPNSHGWRSATTALLSQFDYGRAWDERTGNVKAVLDIGNQVFESMAICDLAEFFERQAIAQETMAIRLLAIEQKMPELLTIQDIIDDLQNSPLATLVPYVELATSLSDLLPNINLQLSAADTLQFLTDFLFKRRLLATLDRIAVGQRIGNLIEGGETVAETVQTIDEIADTTLDLVNTFIGGFGATGELLQALIALYGLFTADGSDDDTQLRALTRQAILSQVLNICCESVPNLPKPAVNPTRVVDIDQTEAVSPTVDATDISAIAWGSPTTDELKCNTAGYILFSIQPAIAGLRDRIPDTNTNLAAIISTAVALIVVLAFPIVLPAVALIGMASVLATLTSGLAIRQALNNMLNVLSGFSDDIRCLLYNATSVADAKTQLKSFFSAHLTIAEVNALMFWFNNTTLSALFYGNPNWNVVGLGYDCSGCAETCQVDLTTGTGPGIPGGLYTSAQVSAQNPNHSVRFDLIECVDKVFTVTQWAWTGSVGNSLQVQYTNPSGTNIFFDLKNATLPVAFNVNGNGVFWITASIAPSGSPHPFQATISIADL